jgi:hypothetical protein
MLTEKRELLALLQSRKEVGPEVSLSYRALGVVPFAAGMIDKIAESGRISYARCASLILPDLILLLLI